MSGGGVEKGEGGTCEGLTEELINCVDDPSKLRSLFSDFYRKVNAMEKKYEALVGEQSAQLADARSRNTVFTEELYKYLYSSLEQDFNCSICSELFIQPAVLDCGHTFCFHCISRWTNGGSRECPICRKASFRPIIKQIGMDNFISKVHERLSTEIQEHREQMIREREREQATAASVAVQIPTSPLVSASASPSPVPNPIRYPSTSAVLNSSIPGSHWSAYRALQATANATAAAVVRPGVTDETAARIEQYEAASRNAIARIQEALRASSVAERSRSSTPSATANVGARVEDNALQTPGSSTPTRITRVIGPRNVARRGGARPRGPLMSTRPRTRTSGSLERRWGHLVNSMEINRMRSSSRRPHQAQPERVSEEDDST